MEQQQDDSFLIAENEEGPTRMGHSNDVIAAATVYEINRRISTVEPHGQHFDEVIRAPHSDGTPNPASPTSVRILHYQCGFVHYQYSHPLM